MNTKEGTGHYHAITNPKTVLFANDRRLFWPMSRNAYRPTVLLAQPLAMH